MAHDPCWEAQDHQYMRVYRNLQKAWEEAAQKNKWVWFDPNAKWLEVNFLWSLWERSLWVAAWCHWGYFARSWLSHHHRHWCWQDHAIHDASASWWQKQMSSLSLCWRFCKLIRCSIIINFCKLILMALKGGMIQKIVYLNDSSW